MKNIFLVIVLITINLFGCEGAAGRAYDACLVRKHEKVRSMTKECIAHTDQYITNCENRAEYFYCGYMERYKK